MNFVKALNEISLNIWALVVMSGGIVLVLRGHADVGATLITGGFALLRGPSPKLPTP